MRAEILKQFYPSDLLKMAFKFQDITDRGTPETIQSLVFIADHREVIVRLHQRQGNLLLNIIRILIFIDEHVFNRGRNLFAGIFLLKEVIKNPLLERKIDTVIFKKQITICDV